MDKVTVAVRADEGNSRGFTGYVVEAGDKDALDKAKSWARITNYNRENKAYDSPTEPNVYEFDNQGFTAKVINSAGGSSQGGRLSFWMCEVEKDGIKFNIGVNDEILAGLIKSSDISNGLVKQKVMFARKGGQLGLIHEGMEFYQDALADMKQKSELKKAKKTTKWEIGGVYSALTLTDVCIGEVWDTMEEYKEETNHWYRRNQTFLRKRKKPVRVLAWIRIYNSDKEPYDFTKIIEDRIHPQYAWFNAGKPPARVKTKQLEIKEGDLELIDKLLSLRNDGDYGERIKGRYTRVK